MRNPCGARKTFTGVRYSLPDFRPTWVRIPKPGNRAANWLVIRFVMARLNAATHLLRNRIRRIGASRNTRNEMTNAAISMTDYLYDACYYVGGSQVGRPVPMTTSR